MKTLFLQVVTPNIESYAKYTKQINTAYANKHGYDYLVVDKISHERHQVWGSIYLKIF